ncbi:hypothetical protein ACSUZJ_18990 [Telluria sp. B2]
MGLRFEKWHPLVIGLTAGIAWAYLFQRFGFHLPADEKEFFAAALSMGAVLTGFIATAQAILMALPSDSVMGRLRSTGYIDDLISYISSALLSGFIFCLLNLIGFALISSASVVKQIYSSLWIWFAIYAGLTFLRVSRVMLKIMRV